MTLFRTVEPAVEPVTLAEAKAHLRITHDSEDELISGLIRAARQEVERTTGSALIEQNWRLALDDWPEGNVVELRREPVQQILSVTVFDGGGAAFVLTPGDYQLDAMSSPARLYLRSRPRPGLPINGIEIDFSAGYGEAGTEVPDLLKRAMLILIAYWYEFRGAYGPDCQPVAIPEEYRRLVAGWRGPRLS
ncbi:head-tail connector protein [Chelativorans sp. SCAU2101]|jgi:phage conserved hypothetical protein, phiE125 gp8 family|uniref:Head-tail connector protein n=1 Tax=Chelativorans petroleitrophicus TaxID=2975484 RepID=A0A9X2XBE4_9HYPH|nr:head-tail connector protein [Chelativorans petroleitrophicus]MCT8991636.1 head-tail connector protein [Chelativorans petroleitrophicus]